MGKPATNRFQLLLFHKSYFAWINCIVIIKLIQWNIMNNTFGVLKDISVMNRASNAGKFL